MVFLPVGTALLYVASIAARFLLQDETWDGSFSRTVFYALGVFLSVGMPQVGTAGPHEFQVGVLPLENFKRRLGSLMIETM